jgi:hypothetical protein
MWLRLEQEEFDLVLEGLAQLPGDDVGRLIERLKEPADPDTAAFAAAVETDDDLEVDSDTVISRGDDGAFVMAWAFVTNEAAGVKSEGDEDDDD